MLLFRYRKAYWVPISLSLYSIQPDGRGSVGPAALTRWVHPHCRQKYLVIAVLPHQVAHPLRKSVDYITRTHSRPRSSSSLPPLQRSCPPHTLLGLVRKQAKTSRRRKWTWKEAAIGRGEKSEAIKTCFTRSTRFHLVTPLTSAPSTFRYGPSIIYYHGLLFGELLWVLFPHSVPRSCVCCRVIAFFFCL